MTPGGGLTSKRTEVMAGMLKVTLVRSMIGRPEKHRQVLRGMGLTRINKTVELEDTPAIRGMIHKVSHLVKAEEKKA
jgi:large subunit ribosomal protein L30